MTKLTKEDALKLARSCILASLEYKQRQATAVEAVQDIDEMLAQPAQEPCARLMRYIGKDTYPKQGYTVARTYEELPKNTYPDTWEEGEALYTTPPAERQWVGLTNEQRNAIGRYPTYVDDIIRATESKLKEKNT